MNRILRKKTFASGIKIQLIQGDITLTDTAGIVNPANSQLAHGGGLAGVLSRKAGPELQLQSAAWVKNHGPVSHEAPAYTGAGNLPFKAVIHAVGPVWGSGDEADKLRAAVLGALQVANDLNLDSLALPAISTGIFGYPQDQAAEIILAALIVYANQNQAASLHIIQLVTYDDQAAAIFSMIWDQKIT